MRHTIAHLSWLSTGSLMRLRASIDDDDHTILKPVGSIKVKGVPAEEWSNKLRSEINIWRNSRSTILRCLCISSIAIAQTQVFQSYSAVPTFNPTPSLSPKFIFVYILGDFED
ncbi:hypothetical protein E3N88_29679 [Mikania micrantha]|uniref:Uncharacterized protein n=1 Tax=Mikania micrantha TaxID=192012 RepID=A0A5N6MJI9_9ASTR|nr:hypothetical protein E3N88_29678 [Mikania micrantha]KAD3640456.1 hypothetical protein E3N88_29679 [Mikania micrantha]